MLYAFKTNSYCLFIYFQNVSLRILHPPLWYFPTPKSKHFGHIVKVVYKKQNGLTVDEHAEEMERCMGEGPRNYLESINQPRWARERTAGATGMVVRGCYRKSMHTFYSINPQFRDEFYHNSKFYSVVYTLSSSQTHSPVKVQSSS